MRYWFYQKFMEFMHRHDWHYAPRIGPLQDGSTQLWCKWCGFRETIPPSDPTKEYLDVGLSRALADLRRS